MPRQQSKPDALFQITEIMGFQVNIENYRGRKGQFNVTTTRGIFIQRQSVISNQES